MCCFSLLRSLAIYFQSTNYFFSFYISSYIFVRIEYTILLRDVAIAEDITVIIDDAETFRDDINEIINEKQEEIQLPPLKIIFTSPPSVRTIPKDIGSNSSHLLNFFCYIFYTICQMWDYHVRINFFLGADLNRRLFVSCQVQSEK